MQQSNLDEPLLVGQSSGRTAGRSFARDTGQLQLKQSKIAQRVNRPVKQGSIFFVGLCLLIIWQCLGLVVALNHASLAFQSIPRKAQALLNAFGAVLLAVGLPLMTAADLDMNAYLSKRPALTLTFVIIYFANTAVVAFTPPQPIHQAQWIANLPWAYLFVFFKPVTTRATGYLWFSELFTLTLATNVLTWAPVGKVMVSRLMRL